MPAIVPLPEYLKDDQILTAIGVGAFVVGMWFRNEFGEWAAPLAVAGLALAVSTPLAYDATKAITGTTNCADPEAKVYHAAFAGLAYWGGLMFLKA